jgi:hypothetical protein
LQGHEKWSLPVTHDPCAVTDGVFLRYLDYFRGQLVSKIESLPGEKLGSSRVPSGWTPLELLKHLTFVELRWLEWGFEGRDVEDPWGDARDSHWHVADDETLESLVDALGARAARTRAVVEAHDLADIGAPLYDPSVTVERGQATIGVLRRQRTGQVRSTSSYPKRSET